VVNSSWTRSDVELWDAHRAARNVAHHQTTPIIRHDLQGTIEQRCCWAISAPALSQLKGKPAQNGADAYGRALDGKPVFSGLQRLAGLVRGTQTKAV
jgi:hypothetical protein